MSAAVVDRADTIRVLLNAGADPNLAADGGKVPLMRTWNLECVRELLNHGANVNARDDDGRSALFHHIQVGSPELIKCYIDAGADVDEADKERVTPLMRVSDEPRIEIADMLLAAGADLNALPWPTCSVLDSISGSTSHYKPEERRALVDFLRSKGAKTAKELKQLRKPR